MRAFEKVRAKIEQTAGQIYNIGGGIQNAVSLLEVIDKIEQVTGKRLWVSLQRPRSGDQLFYVTDFEKLRKHTGWKPEINIRQNIESIYEWWQTELAAQVLISIAPGPALEQIPEAAASGLPWSIRRAASKAR